MSNTWDKIVGWEKLNSYKGQRIDIDNYIYAFANQAVYDADLDEYRVTLFVSSSLYKDQKLIFKVFLHLKGDKNHFGILINQVIGLDENANEKYHTLLCTTYPKMSFTNKLKTPEDFVRFIVKTIIEERNKQ